MIAHNTAINNSGNGDISAGFRVGGSSNITIKHNVATHNINEYANEEGLPNIIAEAWGFTTDPNIGNVTSFAPPVNTNYVIEDNTANQNQAFLGVGGGFKFLSQVNSILRKNVSTDNTIGILVGNPSCCPTDCVGSCPSTGNTVSCNKVFNNLVQGIVDTAPEALTTYSGNISGSNGAIDNNYVGAIFPSPVTCPSKHTCVPANKVPVRLEVNGKKCRLNTNCEKSNKADNLDVQLI